MEKRHDVEETAAKMGLQIWGVLPVFAASKEG